MVFLLTAVITINSWGASWGAFFEEKGPFNWNPCPVDRWTCPTK